MILFFSSSRPLHCFLFFFSGSGLLEEKLTVNRLYDLTDSCFQTHTSSFSFCSWRVSLPSLSLRRLKTSRNLCIRLLTWLWEREGKKRNYQPGLTSGYKRFPLPFHSQAPFPFLFFFEGACGRNGLSSPSFRDRDQASLFLFLPAWSIPKKEGKESNTQDCIPRPLTSSRIPDFESWELVFFSQALGARANKEPRKPSPWIDTAANFFHNLPSSF